MHTMEYFSATKRHEVPVHATTWTNPTNIMPRERNQTPKAIHSVILFIRKVQNRSVRRDRSGTNCLVAVEFLCELVTVFWN